MFCYSQKHTNCHLRNNECLNTYRTIIFFCTISIDNSNQDKQSLISLMVKLVFHPRTKSLHRSNIASVLARLLRSSDVVSSCDSGLQNARATAIRILWKETKTSNSFKSTSSDGNKRSGKRKRQTDRKVNIYSSVGLES